MNIPLLIARRYLIPKRLSFIGIIGLLSVVGIVIGTAALIIVMALFAGFRDVANKMMTGFGPHVRIRAEKSLLADVPGLHPVWLSKLAIQSGGRTSVAFGVGINPSDSLMMEPLKRTTVVGDYALGWHQNMQGAVVAAGLAETMNLYLGDTISLISPQQILSAFTTLSVPNGTPVIVRGLFQSSTTRDVDATYIFVSDSVMMGLTRSSVPTAWDLRLNDPDSAEIVSAIIEQRLPKDATVETWQDMNRGIYDTMRLERIGSFVVLALIIVVAAFNILVSLTLGVIEKQRDISIFKTLGLTNQQIRSAYLIQGLVIGLASVGIGAVVGLGVCYGQQTFHWISFDMSKGYLVPALPMVVQTYDVLLVVGVGLVLSCTAAIYPATRAARTIIAQGLR